VEIEERLFRLAQQLREREIIGSRVALLCRRQGELAAELEHLRKQHALEQHDVEKLESLSLTRVVAGLRGAGRREDRLARERAEADAARYRVAEAGLRLAAIERELAQAEARWSELAEAPAGFAAALDDKEAWVRAVGGPVADQMIRLAQERGRTEAELRELAEAGQAAGQAAQAMEAVAEKLGCGPSFADVGIVRPVGRIGVDRGTRFLDVWFDNILTDLAVRNHIKRAQANLADARQRVADVRRQLAGRTEAARQRRANLDQARQDLLVG
jgi:DNA repair exonuclease SbcCD ATPase subunit